MLMATRQTNKNEKQANNKQSKKQGNKQTKTNKNQKTQQQQKNNKTIPLKSKPRDHANKTVPEHLFLGETVYEMWQTLMNNICRTVSRNVFLQNKKIRPQRTISLFFPATFHIHGIDVPMSL